VKVTFSRIVGVALLVCLIGHVEASRVSKEFRRSIHFRPGGEVRVNNTNGLISVTPWDKDSVEVYAEIEVKARNRGDAEDFMNRVEILIDQHSGQLLVEAEYPKAMGGDGLWDWIFGRKPHVKVEFWLRVPSRTDLQLKSVNGGVDVQDVEGRASLRTTNGSVEADGMKGSVRAQTVNGRIQVGLSRVDVDEKMSFHTTNGSIRLYLPEDIQADIEASTTNGNISTDFPLEVQGKFNRKRIRGCINGGGGFIDLHTVNGSIQISEE
jgi:hypothetical protein